MSSPAALVLATLTAAALLGAGSGGEPAPPAGPDSAGCTSCHALREALSHPVGVAGDALSRPSGDLSASPPLPGGAIECLTCHAERALSPEHASGGRGDPILRRPAATLCVECHGNDPAALDPASPLGHALLLGRAHLDSGGEQVHSVFPDGVDAETRWCLACHDGNTGDVGAARLAGSLRPSVDHPVAVPYEEWSGRGPATLRPLSSLPPEVRLFDGRVGCGSCHALYSGRPYLLSVDNPQGHMCLICHIK